MDNIVSKVKAAVQLDPNTRFPFSNATGSGNTTDLIRYLRAADAATNATAVNDVQNNKTETQGGSSSGNSGSSALAEKGAAAQILTLAVENGGLQREVSGTTVTFRGKPVGLIEALHNYDLLGLLAAVDSSDVKKFLNKLSFALSFDTSRGGVTNTLLANSQQLQSWSLKAEIVNQRDAKARRYASRWAEVSLHNASAVSNAEADALEHGFETAWPEFATWRTQLDTLAAGFDSQYAANHAVLDTLIPQFREQVKARMNLIGTLPNRPANLASLLAMVDTAWKKLDADAKKVMDDIAKGQLLTFDWTTKRDPSLPDLYSSTLIYEMTPFKSSTADFTLNAAVNWYRVAPKMVGASQFKDFNTVAQLDIPLGNYKPIGKFILSFAGKYQYVGDSVTNVTNAVSGSSVDKPSVPAIGGLIPTIKGHLGAFQMKLSIPTGKIGVRVPLAFTAASRSEVFSKPDYRANIGIAFDLDTLFAH
jgi:hypothetical protein